MLPLSLLLYLPAAVFAQPSPEAQESCATLMQQYGRCLALASSRRGGSKSDCTRFLPDNSQCRKFEGVRHTHRASRLPRHNHQTHRVARGVKFYGYGMHVDSSLKKAAFLIQKRLQQQRTVRRIWIASAFRTATAQRSIVRNARHPYTTTRSEHPLGLAIDLCYRASRYRYAHVVRQAYRILRAQMGLFAKNFYIVREPKIRCLHLQYSHRSKHYRKLRRRRIKYLIATNTLRLSTSFKRTPSTRDYIR